MVEDNQFPQKLSKKNEERRIMSEEEFEKEKKELEQILNDENASTSERENARQEIDEIN